MWKYKKEMQSKTALGNPASAIFSFDFNCYFFVWFITKAALYFANI